MPSHTLMPLTDILASHATHWIDPDQCEAVKILGADKVLPSDQLVEGTTVTRNNIGGTRPDPDFPPTTAA